MARSPHQFVTFTREEARLFRMRARASHYDAYLASLAFPYDHRPALHLILCVNHEFKRASEVTSESLLAMIRLTWWREAIEEMLAGKPVRAHELTTPLARLVARYPNVATHLLAAIEAHGNALEPEQIATNHAWEDYQLARMRGVFGAWACISDAGVLHAPWFNPLMLAWGAVEVLRDIPAASMHGVCRIGGAILAEAGLHGDASAIAMPSPELTNVSKALVFGAQKYLSTDRQKKPWLAVQKVLQTRIIQLDKEGFDVYSPRLRLTPLRMFFSILR